MAYMLFTNNAATTLASGITNSATSLTVTTGTGSLFPGVSASQYFYCTLINAAGTTIEIVKVTGRSGDTFTITRAQDNTTASAFSTGDKVELRLVNANLVNLANLDYATPFTGGVYANGSFVGSYSDGVVMDYSSGWGQFTTGTTDGYVWRNNGTTSPTTLMTLSQTGTLTATAFSGDGSLLTGINAGVSLPQAYFFSGF
jgi:hypothetical protein